MRKVMVLQHVSHEPLGTLNPMLKAAGLRIRYVNFARHPDIQPSLDGYSGLVVLGGPMGVYEAHLHPHLRTEMRLIEDAIRRDIPVLGICLGAQLIAHVLGSEVKLAPGVEAGWCEVRLTDHGQKDSLFQIYRPEERIFQLHQDTFTTPKSASHLAFSSLCEGQAFRYGDKVYGLQFHLEVDRAMVRRWLQREDIQSVLARDGRGLTPPQIWAETEAHMARALELSSHSFNRFIDLFALPPRIELIGSGHGKPPKAGD